MTRDPWKLVTDEAQLRAGMCVELRPCNWCGKRERFMLLRECNPMPVTVNAYGERHKTTARKAWMYSSRCLEYEREIRTNGVLETPIRERRLYALIDDDTAADETTRFEQLSDETKANLLHGTWRRRKARA